jgi:hypothetical protein
MEGERWRSAARATSGPAIWPCPGATWYDIASVIPISLSSSLRLRPFVAARLRALSAARLAVTVFLGGCGGQAALIEAWPSSRILDDRGAESGPPAGGRARVITP